MSFVLIQLLSALGVASIIALTWLVGWGKRAVIDSGEAAVARFRSDFPAASVRSVAVDRQGRAALLELGDAVGLVAVAGDRMVTRRLGPADVRPVTTGDQLLLALGDPTLPRVRLQLLPDETARWTERLGGTP